MGNKRKSWLVGLIVIAALAAVALAGLNQSLATYANDYAQVKASPDRVWQVPGVVDKSQPQTSDAQRGTFEFTMRDVETGTQSMRVPSHRIKPGNFDSAAQVVCIGRFVDGVFEADNILVKCPSKEVEKLDDAGASGS